MRKDVCKRIEKKIESNKFSIKFDSYMIENLPNFLIENKSTNR